MLVTNTSLQALRTGFQTSFQAGIGLAAPKSAPLRMRLTSSTKVETYGFLGDMPIFRKWVGDKRVRSIAEKAYALTNEDFEATIGIHKHKIADDNLGLYGPIVQGWGEEAGSLEDRLIFDALANGHARVCFDGQNFFDTDHPVGDTVVSNIEATAEVQPWFLVDASKPMKPIMFQERQKPVFKMVVDPEDAHVFKTGEFLMGGEARGAAGYTYWQLAYRSTKTLNAANYQAAKAAMQAYKNEEGEPNGIKPTHIVVGVSNVVSARDLFTKANLAGGESNVNFGDVTVVEADRLA